ncbi:MAG TPA: plasmid pRiA4b ORF-3 family protein [Anaerolineae bacterium]
MTAAMYTANDNQQTGPPFVYQIKVTLKGLKPPVWRRLQVRSDMTFYELHLALQAAMGWKNRHLYQFNVGGVELSDPVTAAEFGAWNAEEVRLDQFLHEDTISFLYEYDFCDNWRHEVVIEERLFPLDDVHYPLCLAGKRACPPENSGGIGHYASLLQAMGDPGQPKQAELLTVAGGRFDPEAFDVDETNLTLHALH